MFRIKHVPLAAVLAAPLTLLTACPDRGPVEKLEDQTERAAEEIGEEVGESAKGAAREADEGVGAKVPPTVESEKPDKLTAEDEVYQDAELREEAEREP